jgi:hypothetical protein
MARIVVTEQTEASTPTPASGKSTVFVDNKQLKTKHSDGTVKIYSTGVTPEEVQDLVGAMLLDTNTIDFTYDDPNAQISAIVKDSSITNAKVATGIDAAKISTGVVSNTEFNYLDGLTSDIQTQFNNITNGTSANQWTSSSGNVYRTSGNVGSGTNAPEYPLHVVGNSCFGSTGTAQGFFGTADIAANLNYATSYVGFNSKRDSGTWTFRSDGVNNGGCSVFGTINGFLHFSTQGISGTPTVSQTKTDAQVLTAAKMTLSPQGRLGLGIIAPVATLDIVSSEVDVNAIRITNFSTTGSNAASMLNLAGTWNTTGAPTAIKLNITDTASNASSLLMDLQVGGTSKASINKSGVILGSVHRCSGSTSGYVGLKAPATAPSIDFTLPSSDGSSGQVLQTNGSTVLSWVSKENTITAGTTSQFYRGDKTFVTPPDATTSSSGYMSATDKTKLDSLGVVKIIKSTATTSTTSNTVLSNITTMAYTCVAGKVYEFKWRIPFTPAATTTGIQFALTKDATLAGTLIGRVQSFISTTSQTTLQVSNFDTIVTFTASPWYNVLEGIFMFNCTTGGVITPQFCSEVNGSSIALLGFSILEVVEA